MSRHVLLLNADFNVLSLNPLSTINWQNAMKLHFTGAAQVVHEYDDWIIHSPSLDMKVPSVMALTEYRQFKRGVKFSLKNLFLRDNHTCQYCATEFAPQHLTKDHVKPRFHGGKTNWENIVAACAPCNQKRGHNESIRPLREPVKPSIREINFKLTQQPIVAHDRSWKDYLAYHWNEDDIRFLDEQ